MSNKKVIKRYAEHPHQVELQEIKKKYLPLAIQYADLLEHLDVKSIAEFELKINEKSGFVNAQMSAAAYGLEDEYKKLLQLENALEGKLSLNDLTKDMKLKTTFLSKLKEKHTVWYSAEELASEKAVESVLEAFNELEYNTRRKLAITTNFKLAKHPLYNTL